MPILSTVREIDSFITDPEHTSAAIEDLVRGGATAEAVAEAVRGWIRDAVTTDDGATYEIAPAALARFARREVQIAEARIAADVEDAIGDAFASGGHQ